MSDRCYGRMRCVGVQTRPLAVSEALSKLLLYDILTAHPLDVDAERAFSVLNMRSADDLTAVARIRDAAIDQVGQHGFNVGLRAIAQAAGVSAALVIHHFGSKEGLLRVCDDYIAEQIREAKAESLRTSDATAWLAQMAEIECYAPMIAYLVRSMQSGSDLAKTFWQRMIDNAEEYLEEGVRAGTLKPSRDPKARAKFLGMNNGGGLLLYLQMHDNPDRPEGRAARLRRRHDPAGAGAVFQRPDGRLVDVRGLSRPTRDKAFRSPVRPEEMTMTATSLQRASTGEGMAPAVEIHDLIKTFGRTRALDGLNLSVAPGEIAGFLGPNGAGKSTAIRVLLGLLRANSGTVRLLGGDPWRDAVTLHRRIAYVPGDVTLWPNLTGLQAIDFLARLRGDGA